MTPEALELLTRYCDQVLDHPLQHCRPESLGGYATLKYLWPLNDIFKTHLEQLKTIRYDSAYEFQADAAICDYVLKNADWNELPLVVRRVLLERHQQAIMVCMANVYAGNPVVMHIPEEMEEAARTKFVVAFLYHSMTLPHEVTDESHLDIDSAFAHLSGGLH